MYSLPEASLDSIIVVLKICQRLGSWGRSLRQLVGKGTHSSEGNQSLVLLGTGDFEEMV